MNKLDDILRRHTFPVHLATLYSGSSGRLRLDVDSPPFTEHTFTWVASLTKLVTSIAVMQLVQRGRLSLDADLRPLVPELRDARILRAMDRDGRPAYERNTRPITMRQLLTHTSGFSYEFADPVLLAWSRSAPGRDVSRMHWSRLEISTPLRFAPGQGWAYGVGVDWAGQVVEAVTGGPLSRHVRDHILRPLGLADTGFWPERHPQTAPRTAQNVERTRSGRLRPAAWPTPHEHEMESGGAGLFTTASDYAALLRGFLRGSLVSDDTVRAMLAPQLDEAQAERMRDVATHPRVRNTFVPEFADGQDINHGLGGMLNVGDVPGKRRGGSMAWSGILNSRWWADPTTGIAAVLVVNVRPNGDPIVAKLYDELERAVYAHLLGDASKSRI
ncbi:hypothetical protein UVI_02063080 [Ustilaginoidea virens]|uniref:Beta-lactamase-related domain-containing protein n=1 Tax=Ustilaginoidea virens TaxID=1159556 RepID=A0A1B5L668_USTVR|nr:hypothetical protein UVI_02063080 [Ustilaginoidea virens]